MINYTEEQGSLMASLHSHENSSISKKQNKNKQTKYRSKLLKQLLSKHFTNDHDETKLMSSTRNLQLLQRHA